MNPHPEISVCGIFLQVTLTCCMRGSPLGAGEAIPLPATDLSAARFITNCLRSLCCSSILTTTSSSSTFYFYSFSSFSSSSPLCPLLLGIHQGPVRVRLFAPALRWSGDTTASAHYTAANDPIPRKTRQGTEQKSWISGSEAILDARPAGSLGGD